MKPAMQFLINKKGGDFIHFISPHQGERKRLKKNRQGDIHRKPTPRIGLLGQMGHFRYFLPFFLLWSQKESAFPTPFGLFQTPGGSGPSWYEFGIGSESEFSFLPNCAFCYTCMIYEVGGHFATKCTFALR